VLVDELYQYRDHFFENYPIELANERPRMLENKLKECIKGIDRLEIQSQFPLSSQPDESGDAGIQQPSFHPSFEPSSDSSIKSEAVEVGLSNCSLINQNADTRDQDIQRINYNIDHYESQNSIHEKARALYLRGRALNVTTKHDPESERLLSKSVKLEPSFVEAWNELGESYWKREDVDNARICFEGALSHRENKISLRKLSIVLRQKSSSLPDEERLRAIEAGLTKAREAVQLDTADGISWSILGNAYLAHFFSVSQNPRTLRQAMSAYKQAEKDVVAKSSPELHYNKAIALKYEEEYNGSLEGFAKAYALDPSWQSAREQEGSLMKSLLDVQHLIECKGKLKNKKFNLLVSSLGPPASSTDSNIPNKQLGPFVNSMVAATQGKGSKGYTQIDFADLLEDTYANTSGDGSAAKGNNEGKVIIGKVICSVHSEQSVPFTFCMTDRQGHCVAVNLYNLAPGKGVIIGDSVAIAEPNFRKINIAHIKQVTITICTKKKIII
jgi:tetratricopeptide (TPR) repeat protein